MTAGPMSGSATTSPKSTRASRRNSTPRWVSLRLYALPLANPLLLIVSDLLRFRIRTNRTNSVTRTYEFGLDDLTDAATRCKPKGAVSGPGAATVRGNRSPSRRPNPSRRSRTRSRSGATTRMRWRTSSAGSPSTCSPTTWACSPGPMFTRCRTHARQSACDTLTARRAGRPF